MTKKEAESSSLVKLNSSREQASVPLNQFKASHDVTVKPVSIYDSMNKTQVNFPTGLMEQSSTYPDSQHESTYQASSITHMKASGKKDSPTDIMVR